MMGLARGGYTEAQVLQAVRGVYGTRRLEFRYELLDEDGQLIRNLDNVLSCSIDYDGSADIKRTARLELTETGGAIDYLRHRIKPYVRLHVPPLPAPGELDPGSSYEEATGRIRGLLARWRFDEHPGDGAVSDRAEDVTGRHPLILGSGVTQNLPALIEAEGRAAGFDGTGTGVATSLTAGEYLNSLTALTFAGWFRSDTVGQDRTYVAAAPANTWAQYLGQTWDAIEAGTYAQFDVLDSPSTWGAVEAAPETWDDLNTWRTPLVPRSGFAVEALAATKNLRVTLHIGPTVVTAETPANTQTTERTFVAFTWVSGGNLRVYLNGDLAAETASQVTGGLQGVGALSIGGGTRGYRGVVDDVLLASSVLTAESVRTLHVVGAAIGPAAGPGQTFVEWPQGVFVLSSPTRSIDDSGTVTRDVDGYDQASLLDTQLVGATYYVSAGTRYTDAVAELLNATPGLGPVDLVPSSAALPAQRMWNAGTSHLKIVGDLLEAVNYEPLHFDEDGTALVRPYIAPQVRKPEYVYDTGEVSVLVPEATQRLDLYRQPNQWVLVVSEPDRPVLRAVYTNTDPASPTSTANRGRTITDYRTEQDVADQAVLNAKARQVAQEASEVFEEVRFSTALMPFHAHRDVYRLSYPELDVEGIYAETRWSYDLRPGAEMNHTARRVVILP